MKVNKFTTTQTTVSIEDGERSLELTFEDNECIGCISNLNYHKTLEDWKWYGIAINKLIKEYEKH